MEELFNRVSNAPISNSYVNNTGNDIVSNGDALVLSAAAYKCSSGPCASEDDMLWTVNLFGTFRCKPMDLRAFLMGNLRGVESELVAPTDQSLPSGR